MYEQISANIWRSRLLLFFFILFVMLMGYVFYMAYDNPIALPIALIVAVVSSVGGYYNSDKIVLASTGAKPAEKSQYPHYVNSVEGLALAAGIPTPRPYIVEDPAPNAFATGRDPEHAAIAVTTGLLDTLNRTELEGVIAHELAHIKNYDIRFMALVAVLVGSIALLANWFWRYSFYGFGRRRYRRSSGKGQLIFIILAIVLAILAPISAALVQAAVSRQREYLADSSGAMFSRYPEGLASALEKIGKDQHRLQTANKANAHLFIINPLKNQRQSLKNLFSTHPPLEERIRRLRGM